MTFPYCVGDLTSPATCLSYLTSHPNAIASASDLISPSTGLIHVSPLSSAAISTATTLTVTTTPSNSTCVVVSAHPSPTTPDSRVTAAIGTSTSTASTQSFAQSSSAWDQVLSPITQFLTYPVYPQVEQTIYQSNHAHVL